MAKSRWDRDTIIKRVLALYKSGADLTCSSVKEIDSALVGASISYFGSWGAAVRAAGLGYAEIKKKSQLRRREKIRKWTVEKVLDEIRQIAETEDDLSNAYMKEKYSTLVAAATNYVGSWKQALEMLGYDYNDVLRKGREKRLEREKEWYRNLLLERLDKMKTRDGKIVEKIIREKEPKFHALLLEYFSSWRKVISAYNKMMETHNNGKDNS